MVVVMKKLLILLAIFMVSAGVAQATTHLYSNHDFEQAVRMIKKYETLHTAKHWPLIGYGHKVQPGEKYKQGQVLSEKEADALLRKDLKKLVTHYKSYGKDALLLGVLAYNVGIGRVNRSTLVKMLKDGNRNIQDVYTSFCKYKGREHKGIKTRRVEELSTLYRA